MNAKLRVATGLTFGALCIITYCVGMYCMARVAIALIGILIHGKS